MKIDNMLFGIMNRVPYIVYQLVCVLLGMMIISLSYPVVIDAIGEDLMKLLVPLSLLVLLPLMIVLIIGSVVGRLHALKLSGWWAGILIVPFISYLFIIVLMFLPTKTN